MQSDKNYQPQWLMSGLGYYLSVVLYPSKKDQRPVSPNDIGGLKTMNRFFDLVEEFVSSDEKKFPDLCATHFLLGNDKCYRMNISEIAKEDYKKGKSSLYRMMVGTRGPYKPYFTVEAPSQKVSTYHAHSLEIVVVQCLRFYKLWTFFCQINICLYKLFLSVPHETTKVAFKSNFGLGKFFS